MKYTVHENDKVTEYEASPEMAESLRKAGVWWKENGCRCSITSPEDYVTHPRGHSVDVSCRQCGGWIQIG